MNKNITAGLAVVLVGAVAFMASGHAYALAVSGNVGAGVQAAMGGAASGGATSSVGVGVDASAANTASGSASDSGSAAAQLLISQPMPIMTSADLATYDDIVVKARPAVAAINVNNTDNTIAIQYSEPAKLFGIFSASITGNVVVDAQGNASVQFPWWSVFYTKNTAGVQTSVNAAITGSGASFDAEADAPTRLQNEARVIDAVTGALQARAVATATASASASTNASAQ